MLQNKKIFLVKKNNNFAFVLSLLSFLPSFAYSKNITTEKQLTTSKQEVVAIEEENKVEQLSEEQAKVNADTIAQAEEALVVVVDGDYICSDMTGISEFKGIEGQDNKLYLTEDVKIDHKVSFSNLTIVGDVVESRSGGKSGKRFGLETVNGGAVNFGKNVTLKNCLIRNLKQQTPSKPN